MLGLASRPPSEEMLDVEASSAVKECWTIRRAASVACVATWLDPSSVAADCVDVMALDIVTVASNEVQPQYFIVAEVILCDFSWRFSAAEFWRSPLALLAEPNAQLDVLVNGGKKVVHTLLDIWYFISNICCTQQANKTSL